jgi:Fic family protein
MTLKNDIKQDIPPLPLDIDFETRLVMRKTAEANRYLAELKGLANTMPNPAILIDTLALQEARESSAIENIITTYDEVYQSDMETGQFITPATKEVLYYAKALHFGFDLVTKTGLLTNNTIIDMQAMIEHNKAGYRKLPGTHLKNDATGEVVYTPPQHYDDIVTLMGNLEAFINDDALSDIDPLIKMAIIHHRFETIHPFYDGNGRTGRIVNILYLIKCGLLALPILYLSRYIIRHKAAYYQLLQSVRTDLNWEPWILFFLEAIIYTSQDTMHVIDKMGKAMQTYKHTIKQEHPKMYSHDLINNLFKYPYTKIEYIIADLDVSRNTAIRYLEQLEQGGLVTKKKIGKTNFYLNNALTGLLIERD